MQPQNFFKIFVSLLFGACFITIISLFATSGDYLLKYDPRAMDFFAFYTGAEELIQNPTHLYDLPEQEYVEHCLLPITKTQNIFIPFLNPPLVAIMFLPFVKFDVVTAYNLWLLLNSLLVIIIGYLFYREVRKIKPIRKLLFLFAVITFIPILTSLLIGQLSILLLLILLSSWLLLRKKKLFLSGLLFSLLLIKPHFFLLGLLVHLIQRRKQFLLGLTAGFAIQIFLLLILVGDHGIVQYISLLTNATGWNNAYRIDLFAQHSLQTVLLLLFQTTDLSAIRFIWFAVTLIFILPILWIWRKGYPLNSIQTKLQWALLILTMLLTSPHTHFHDLTLLLLLPLLLFKEMKHYFLFFIIGYGIDLIGYMLTVYFGQIGNHIWIFVDVLFQIILWITLYKHFNKLNKHKKDMLR